MKKKKTGRIFFVLLAVMLTAVSCSVLRLVGNNQTNNIVSVGKDSSVKEDSSVEEEFIEIEGIVTPVNGAWYYGPCGSKDTVNQLNSTEAEDYNVNFECLYLVSTESCIYLSNPDSSITINLYGSNQLRVLHPSTLPSYVIHSDSTKGNCIIGHDFEKDSLYLTGDIQSTIAMKGDWVIENATIDFYGCVDSSTRGAVVPISQGITLRKNALFHFDCISFGMTSIVGVLESDNGYLSVNLGAAAPGVSTLTIIGYPNPGYELTGLLVNDEEVSFDTALVMPGNDAGEDGELWIQGIFTAIE